MYHPQIPMGEDVTVEVRYQNNLLPELFPNRPETIFYKGKVVSSAHYDERESMRLFTGNKEMMIRVIHFKNIVSVNGTPFEFTPQPKITPPQAQTITVESSKPGKTYTVTISPQGQMRCTCAGFGFRQKCSHIEKILEKARV